MEDSPKLVCRKTLIHINKGKTYGRQGKAPTGLTFNKVDYIFFRLPFDVIDIAMLPAQRFWRETLSLLDVMRPLSNQ